MKTFLLVGIGGFIGSYFRYLLSLYIEQKLLSTFPYGTFAVNILGCFLIGLLFGLSKQFDIAPEYRLLLGVGFCGGFTTFSTFSYEGIMLLQDAQFLVGFLYGGLSLIIGFFAAWIGLIIARIF